jgi:hypothetical protein
MSTFGSFWLGELSPYEKASLSSFVEHGHTVVLYSYKPFQDLPTGIIQLDAKDVVPESYIGRFITDGRRNVANFSDYFRYKMFLKKQVCWIDSDVMMLKSFEINADESFLVAEADSICNAILSISASSDELKQIIKNSERVLDQDIPYATLQTYILLAFRRKRDIFKSAEAYMPFHHSEFYKYLLPEYRDECEQACQKAFSIHLYNNIWDKIGYYKDLLPPEGSYLHELLKNSPVARQFKGVYPASVVRALVDGWRLRFSGEALSVGPLLKQLLPSTVRTMKRLRAHYTPILRRPV